MAAFRIMMSLLFYTDTSCNTLYEGPDIYGAINAAGFETVLENETSLLAVPVYCGDDLSTFTVFLSSTPVEVANLADSISSFLLVPEGALTIVDNVCKTNLARDTYYHPFPPSETETFSVKAVVSTTQYCDVQVTSSPTPSPTMTPARPAEKEGGVIILIGLCAIVLGSTLLALISYLFPL